MSAWVRWRIVAGALILGFCMAGEGFGAVVNGVMRTERGYYFDLQHLLSTISRSSLPPSRRVEPVCPRAHGLR